MKLEEFLSLKIFSLLGNLYLLFCLLVMVEFFVISKFENIFDYIKLLHFEFIFPSLNTLSNIFSIFLITNIIIILLFILELILNITRQKSFQFKNNFYINQLFFYIGFIFNCTFSVMFLYFVFTI